VPHDLLLLLQQHKFQAFSTNFPIWALVQTHMDWQHQSPGLHGMRQLRLRLRHQSQLPQEIVMGPTTWLTCTSRYTFLRLSEAAQVAAQRDFFGRPPREQRPRSPLPAGRASRRTPAQEAASQRAAMSREYRAERYTTAIEIALASGNIAATARAADIPRTTLRGAIARQTNFGNPIVRTPGVSAGAGSVITTEIEEILQDLVDERPELTLLELVGEIEARCNILVDRTTVLRHLQALHITNKRLVLVPAERNTPEACQKRQCICPSCSIRLHSSYHSSIGTRGLLAWQSFSTNC